jgi:hypothetical protein
MAEKIGKMKCKTIPPNKVFQSLEDTRQRQDTIQHNTTQHNTTQHNTTQHNTTQHNKNMTCQKKKYAPN